VEANAEVTRQARRRSLAGTMSRRLHRLTARDWITVGSGAGLIGGLAMAIPLIIWDWVRTSHLALELPTATAAWLFGLDHFSHTTYRGGPLVVGAVFLCLYWIVSGVAFAGFADRLYHITTMGKSLIAGAVWSFISFLLFWDVILPIARDGAPFRATAALPSLFVAPNWVWILAFTVFGLVTGAVYAALRNPDRLAGDDAIANGR
jgi:hypothetical protein